MTPVRARGRRTAAVAFSALALLVIPMLGCGGDDDEPESASAPTTTTSSTRSASTTETTTSETTTEPTTTTDTTPTETETESDETESDETESDETEDTGGTAPSTDEDTAENDVPPPPDSPAERFEERCERKPESC